MKSDVGEVDLTNTLVRSVHNVFSSGDKHYHHMSNSIGVNGEALQLHMVL